MAYNISSARDFIRLALELNGHTESIIIDTGIYKHYSLDELLKELNIEDDMYTIEASIDNPIKLENIEEVISYMEEQFDLLYNQYDCDNRSYFYSDLHYDLKKCRYEVRWSS